MDLPFTSAQFFDVFRRYNEAIWPNQWLLFLLAVLTITMVGAGGRNGRSVTAALGFLWLWMAVAYHFAFFRHINPAAIGFAIFFAVEATLLVTKGSKEEMLVFRIPPGLAGVLAASTIGYALILYPLIGYALGQRYPSIPTFGLPCPTTIFTLGILSCGTPAVTRKLAVIPLLWALIASQAAFALGVWEDLGLLAGVAVFLAVSWGQGVRVSRPRVIQIH
jgi:hypothetical protein